MTEKQLKVGLVGLGFIGKVHAHAYHSIPYCFSQPKINARLAAVLRSASGRDRELLKNLGGPLETADLGGLDVFADIAAYLVPDLCSSPVPPPVLAAAKADGNLGAKTGRGFYDWSDGRKLQAVRQLREAVLADWLRRDRETAP